MMHETSDILVVGSVALDDIETPHGKYDLVLGGSATYASCSASHFTSTAIVGVVGEDFPDAHVQLLLSRRISLEGLQREKGKTFHWRGSYEGDMGQAKTHDTRLGVFEAFSPRVPEVLKRAEWVLLGNIHPSLQIQVIDQMEAPKLVAADTMNFWISGERDTLGRLLRRVDMLFVNDAEIRMLTGEKNLPTAAAKCLDMGPKVIVLKRGENGASIHTRDHILFVPPYPARKVFDPTGAGDSLAGGMLGFLSRKGSLDLASLHESALVGTVMSSFCIEEFSPLRLANLTETEIEERLEELKSTIHPGLHVHVK